MLKNLKLERPIAFFDLETTGTRYYIDRIIEFSVLKMLPDGTEEYKSRRVNPEMIIQPGATGKHGITNADLEGEPIFRQLAKGILEFMQGCDLCGFNILNFDVPLLEHEFRRVGMDISLEDRFTVDLMTIYHSRVPYDPENARNLENAYLLYCGKEIQNAHSAEGDVKTSVEILDGQLAMYEDLPRDVEGLHKLCLEGRKDYVDIIGRLIWKDGEAAVGFGKHKGRTLREIVEEAPDYLEWIMGQDFSPEVKEIIDKALKGEYPVR